MFWLVTHRGNVQWWGLWFRQKGELGGMVEGLEVQATNLAPARFVAWTSGPSTIPPTPPLFTSPLLVFDGVVVALARGDD